VAGMSAGAAVSQLHAWLAVVAAVVAAAIVVLGVLDAGGWLARSQAKRWLDRAMLALLAVVAVAAVVGPIVLVLVGPPREWLHLVYAAAALAAAPVGRAIAATRAPARMGGWVAVGGLVTLAALLRLWGTGG
jgi:hypothetical protein